MILAGASSESYFEYSRRLGQLHALIRIGEGDSDEAEAIRDNMDDYYRRLKPEEIELLNLLSADLNRIGEDVTPAAISIPVEVISQLDDIVGGRCDPEGIRHSLDTETNNPGWNALIRFLYWSSLGDLEAARPFVQFAVACMEHNLADVRMDLLKVAQDLQVASPGSGESEVAELRQRAEHLRQSEEQLRGLVSTFEAVKSRVGSLGDDNHTQRTATLPSRDSEVLPLELGAQLVAMLSSMNSIHQAA